jgi:hypothetical protein
MAITSDAGRAAPPFAPSGTLGEICKQSDVRQIMICQSVRDTRIQARQIKRSWKLKLPEVGRQFCIDLGPA